MCTGDYDKHINIMFSTDKIEEFTDKKINEVFNNLIKCLPNNGKLYKYRRFDDNKQFSNTYDSLKEGYLWSSRVEEFFDDTDCTINYDIDKECKKIQDMLSNNPLYIVKIFLQALSSTVNNINQDFDDSMLLRMIDYYDKEKNAFDVDKSVNIYADYGCDIETSKIVILGINKYIKEIMTESSKYVKEIAENFINLNKYNRHNAFVCSLCSAYDISPMWDIYAGKCGFCIEYDYNKLKDLSADTKKLFNSIYKVIYNNDPDEVELVPLILQQIKCGYDQEVAKKYGNVLLMNTITKEESYSYEREWRLYHYNLNDNEPGEKLKANIVSKIIIDERALNNDNANRLIKLCQTNNWDIDIRIININNRKHQYIPYEEYMKRGDKDV